MEKKLKAQSQITFLYYYELDTPGKFYQDVMGFELIEDQGTARIYRVCGNAHLGIVNQATGFHRAQPTNAVEITLVVDDVEPWYQHLKSKGVKFLREPIIKGKTVHSHNTFVIEDPGGYTIEVQQFLIPETAAMYVDPK